MTHACDREKDGQTDILVANAVLHYVALSKNGLDLAQTVYNVEKMVKCSPQYLIGPNTVL